VNEYVRGHDLKRFLQYHTDDTAHAAAIIKRVTDMLRSLLKLEVTHGDLKTTNIMINEHAHPVLIDLDGAREHQASSSLNKAWQQELKRLLQNFDDAPTLRDLLRASFRQP
jgi:RIO-like serine/threonine protein kinase